VVWGTDLRRTFVGLYVSEGVGGQSWLGRLVSMAIALQRDLRSESKQQIVVMGRQG
jgi:hypothetical protein